MWKLLFIYFIFHYGEGALILNAKNDSKTCASFPIADENVAKMGLLAESLDTFLDRNLEGGHETLKKILETYGSENDAIMQVEPGASLAAFLLHHQIAIHNNMKQMFHDIKKTLLGQTGDLKSTSNSRSLNPAVKKGMLPLHGVKNSNLLTDSAIRPADCSELLVAGHKESGVYEIYPFRCHCTPSVKVYCDMETDGGGWTVFLSRTNMSKPVNFSRNWEEYKHGFGVVGEEYWLGNENLHTLTTNRYYTMRMEISDQTGRSVWGEWNVFKVDPESNRYRLVISHFNPKSTAYDRMSYHNANYFSTYDVDNDKQSSLICANKHKGGWWYNACQYMNPTGLQDRDDDTGMQIKPWSKVDSTTRYAKFITMKIRPTICNTKNSVANLNTHKCSFD